MSKSSKKVLIKSKEQRLEVFKNLEWYVKVFEEFPEFDCDGVRSLRGVILRGVGVMR